MANESHSLHRETAAARALLDALRDDLDGDEPATADAVEGETNLMEAVERAAARILELSAYGDVLGAQIAAMKERQARFERQVEKLRTAILAAMDETGLKKIERPLATLSVRPAPPKAVVTSEADLPSHFWKLPDPVLDKKALNAALKNGQHVPGAALSNPPSTLQIRFK